MFRRDGAGVVLIDEVRAGCSRVLAGESGDDLTVRRRAGKSRDPRLIGDTRDSSKTRFVSFKDSRGRMSEGKLEGRPLKAKRILKEAGNSIRDAGQGPWDDLHTIRGKRSGVADRSSSAREHRHIRVTLRTMQMYDQLDLTNVAGCECLGRRLWQLEVTTERNPRLPDFEGLDVDLDVAVGEVGSKVFPKFDSWFGEQPKAEAVYLRACRMWRMEHATTTRAPNSGNNGNGGGGNHNGGDNNKNNNKNNKKNGDNPGGGGGAAAPSS